jgi:crotonobetainyl-CoA:carnitine CoA-transferase CaiB-like acyl-CoA transferase
MTTTNGTPPGALTHLRIVEYGDWPAAYTARWLGDMGADVIKVELPGGDPNRLMPPFAGNVEDKERSLSFINANINKRSIVLDLANSQQDRQTLLDLLAGADAFIEATPPGTLESWGLAQGTLLARNPHLVTVSLTPFGQWGPYSPYKGNHAVVEAMAGFMSAHGDDQKPPVVTPAHQTYQVAAVHGAYLTLAGVRHAKRTGAGQRIDLSLQEAITYMGSSAIARYTQRSEIVARNGAKPQGGGSNIFRCKDGRYVYISIYILPHWHAITREWMEDPVLSSPEWDDAQYRGDNGDVINALFGAFIEQFTADEFVEECQRRGLPCAQVNTPGEFMDSAQLKARKWIQKFNHPVIGEYDAPGFLFKMYSTPLRQWRPAPLLGQHQQEVLAEAKKGRQPVAATVSRNGANPEGPMLEGIRVADLTRFFAGPIGTMFLGFYGAETVKVESELLVANREPTSPLYPDMNRNKLSVTIDTRNEGGKALMDRLLEHSDVLVDNFSPRVIDRLGFGWKHVHEVNPNVVQITAPGMGLDGPLTSWVTWGNQLVAYTGLSYMWGYPDSPMDAHGKLVIPDYLGASCVALSSLAALEHRDSGGAGQFIELTQVEAQGAIMGPAILDATVNGHQWEAMGYEEVLGARCAPYGAYPCKGEDSWVVIGCETDAEWQGLGKAMGAPRWTQDPQFATRQGRRENRDELDAQISDWTRGFTPSQAMRILQKQGVPAGAVQNGETLYSDLHLRKRGHVVDVHEPPWGDLSHQGLPGIPSRSRAFAGGLPPWIGAHNDYVFGAVLGMSPEEIKRGIEGGAIK